jgi:hypothetical protein
VGPPVGPTGAALSCAGDADAPEPRRWRIAPAMTWAQTEIVFADAPDGLEIDIERFAATAAIEYRVSDDWTFTAGAGASIGGEIVARDVRHELGAGPVGLIGGGYRILDGDGWEPFLMLGLSAAVSSVPTTAPGAEGRFTGVDVRGGLMLGEVFLDSIAPYAALRGFGGPVFWEFEGEGVRGTDKWHFQLGAGLLATAGWIDAWLEIIPLGERAVSIGTAVSF